MNVHDDKTNNDSYDCCPPGSHGAPVPEYGATKAKATTGSAPTVDGTIPVSYFDETPKGEFITLNDFDRKDKNKTPTPCYYTSPPTTTPPPQQSTSSKYGLIVYPDVWGFQSRILRIADYLSFQLNCHVVVCDCFRGETKDTQPNIVEWFQNVSYDDIVGPDTTECLMFLKQQKNVTEFAALGFCWGAWAIGKTCQALISDASIDLKITENTIPSWKAVVSPHPSFGIEKKVFGGDDVKLMQSIGNVCPLLLLPAGNDPGYTKPTSVEFQFLQELPLVSKQRNENNGKTSSSISSSRKSSSSKSIEFPEMKHGWTTRGDLSSNNEIPSLKRDLDLALHEIVDFLRIHLLSYYGTY